MLEQIMAYAPYLPTDWLALLVAGLITLVTACCLWLRVNHGRKNIREHLKDVLTCSNEDFLTSLLELKIYRHGWLTLHNKMGWHKISKKQMAQVIEKLIREEPHQVDSIAKSLVSYYTKVYKTKWLPYDQQKFVEKHVDDLILEILDNFDRYRDRWFIGQINQAVDAALGQFVATLKKQVTDEQTQTAKNLATSQANAAKKILNAPPVRKKLRYGVIYLRRAIRLKPGTALSSPAKADSL